MCLLEFSDKPRHQTDKSIFSSSLILFNTPAADARSCSFRDAAAELTPTLVPTHPPTLQRGTWRVEEERLKYTVQSERREGKAVGEAGDKAVLDKHLGRERDTVESGGGRIRGTEADKWRGGCRSHEQMEER